MIKEIIEVELEEYVLDGTKSYTLYDNAQQNNLLAMAYDEEQIKEESKYYSEGVWFEYDNVIDSNNIINERKYRKKVKFPVKPEKRPSYLEISEQYQFNTKMGDIR